MVIIGIFILIVLSCTLLYLPAICELLSRDDALRLHIDETFVRDPRFFGKSFRDTFSSVARADATENALLLVARESLHVKKNGMLPTTYVQDSVTTEDEARIVALASDGSVCLGRGSRVTNWVDAEEDVHALENCSLGRSVSSGKSVRLEVGCTFDRVFGRPIVTMQPTPMLKSARASGCVLTALTSRKNIISKTSIRLDEDTVLSGSIKSHGSVEILRGATIFGNIFARGSVRLHPDVLVTGTIHAEGDIQVEQRAEVGSADAYVTVFSGGAIVLASHVCVYGWIVAERGGCVR